MILSSRFPYPLEKGDKLRLYHQIRGLSQQHEVVLVALSEHQISKEHQDHVLQFCEKVYVIPISKWNFLSQLTNGIFGSRPFQVLYFYHNRVKRKIKEIALKEDPDHVYCQLIRTTEYGRNLPFAKTVDYMDAFSNGMAKRARKAPAILRPFYKMETNKLAEYEKDIYKDFDNHIIISAQDKQLLGVNYNDEIRVLPNGIDQDYFSFKERNEDCSYDYLFIGNMGYHPNIEAAIFIAKRVMPQIWMKFPEAKLLIAGARPSTAVKALESDKITVSGWMEDIRDAYYNGKIFIAPLFTGIGQQNKILEAMSTGVPCITTKMVNNAIGAVNGESILIAETAADFANQAIKLRMNQGLAKNIAVQAKDKILSKYHWEQHAQQLNEILASTKNFEIRN